MPSPAVTGRGILSPGEGSSLHREGSTYASSLSSRGHPGLVRCRARPWGVNLQGNSNSAERRAALIISSLLLAAGFLLARNASREGTSMQGGWVRYKEGEKCRARGKETELLENSFWAAPGWRLFGSAQLALPRAPLSHILEPGESWGEGPVLPVWRQAPERSQFSEPGFRDVGEQRPDVKRLGERGSEVDSPVSA